MSDGTTATDIRNDVTNFQFSTPRGVQDITGVDKSAFERLLLLADFSITLNGVFNTALSHTVFKTVSSTTAARTTSLTVSSQSLPNECMYTDYALTRADSGELTWSAPGVLSDGTVPLWS
ncbi:hypothetical protein [Streptomyces sp. YIM S03343]